MEPITIVLIVGGLILLLVLIGLLSVSIARRSESDPFNEALSDYVTVDSAPSASLEDIELNMTFSQRVLIPLAQQIARFTQGLTPEETLDKTRRQIRLAGNPNNLNPTTFWGIRFMAMAGLAFVLFLVMLLFRRDQALWVIGATLLGGAVGYFLPFLWLRSKIQRRQDEIIKALPDALDLMSIAVEAGLGFDQAMSRVYEKWDNELALAFGRVVKEIQVGKSRRDALRSMAESVDVPDMTTFTGAIIQADQLGVSIAKVLKIQSEQMRVKRRQRAQEKAQQAPVKMMIPMVLFIFPSIWIVLLGPAAVQLARQFLDW